MKHRETDIVEQSFRRSAWIDEAPAPAVAAAFDFPDRARIPAHRHKRGQLIYASSGVMTVSTGAGAWVVPPDRAVWMPAGVEHWIQMAGLVRMRTVYFKSSAVAHLPVGCAVMPVSALLRELILAAIDLPAVRAPKGRAALILGLILEEMRALPALPLHLPMPSDERVARICRALLERPGSPRTLDDWAVWAGVSARTVARGFVAQTGMSFARWRQQARVIASLPRLAKGESVIEIALDLGYDNPSAFSAMFRRTLGAPPTKYFAAPCQPG